MRDQVIPARDQIMTSQFIVPQAMASQVGREKASGLRYSVPCIVRPVRNVEEAESVFWRMVSEFGWNRSPRDGRTHWYSAGGGEGFHVVVEAELKNGILVEKADAIPQGCILSFCYGNQTGWIGFFCVTKSRQRMGWGGKLWDAAMKTFQARNIHVVGLDAVAEQVPRYAKLGFMESSKINVMMRASPTKEPLAEQSVTVAGRTMVGLKHLRKQWLEQSDLANTGLQRGALWTDEAIKGRVDVTGRGVVDLDASPDDLSSWVAVRSCEHGYRFGPLYAESAELAAALLRNAMLDVRSPSEKVSFVAEVWEANPRAVALFEEEGWLPTGVRYSRMWLNGKVPVAQQRGGRAEKNCFAIFDAGEG